MYPASWYLAEYGADPKPTGKPRKSWQQLKAIGKRWAAHFNRIEADKQKREALREKRKKEAEERQKNREVELQKRRDAVAARRKHGRP